jgi:hypothetical protein
MLENIIKLGSSRPRAGEGLRDLHFIPVLPLLNCPASLKRGVRGGFTLFFPEVVFYDLESSCPSTQMLGGRVHPSFNLRRIRRVLLGEREDLERLAQHIIRNRFAIEKMPAMDGNG